MHPAKLEQFLRYSVGRLNGTTLSLDLLQPHLILLPLKIGYKGFYNCDFKVIENWEFCRMAFERKVCGHYFSFTIKATVRVISAAVLNSVQTSNVVHFGRVTWLRCVYSKGVFITERWE